MSPNGATFCAVRALGGPGISVHQDREAVSSRLTCDVMLLSGRKDEFSCMELDIVHEKLLWF